MINTFKNIVLLSYISYVVWFFLPYIYETTNPVVLDVLIWNGYGGFATDSLIIAYLFLAIYSIATLGLLYFKIWAKPLFLTLTIISIGFCFLNGLSVSTPIDNFLMYITTLADGAILAMLYFSDIKNEFNESV